MIYNSLKTLVLPLLRCPGAPPEPPAGSHESVVIFRASRAYLRYRILTAFAKITLMLIFEIWGVLVLALTSPLGNLGILLALLLLSLVTLKALVIYFTTRLDYDMRYYIITNRSLRIREGVWVIRETTFTFENIQNMKIAQGPIQRLFGIADLIVETAGGGGAARPNEHESQMSGAMHRGAFRGLGKPAELRDQILQYLRQVRTKGLGDHDERPASATVAFGPPEIETLRAIRNEVRAWRETLALPERG